MRRLSPGLAAMLLCAAGLFWSAVPASSQETPDVNRLGPQTGQAVPGFTLPDQDGVPRTLQSLMGPKGLVLVFSRSADW